MSTIVLRTDLPGFPCRSRGKVRDIYDLGDSLLIVVTDRISAFDHVLPNGIPDKGRVLNLLSAFWMNRTEGLVPNHLISTRIEDLPEALHAHREVLEGRFTLARKARMLPMECIVRGYLVGSGWKDYQETGAVCGISLPEGIVESGRLPDPIFTPSTKAESGHDQNIPFEEVVRQIGPDLAREVREASIALYRHAEEYGRSRGIIIADTKFEFGIVDGRLTLCDEVLTPDSSRFWPADSYEPGRSQPSFDKQYVRDYLLSIHWNKEPPIPTLPEEVVDQTADRYREAYRRLVGRDL
ncbi:MAG TPA: phosphoribosylaminoimidazolesuccinocarboxamide synthase [Myxococcota bacterium]|nr:phosphoribosylaminoimidazolesuccinocarboxamide synthase [Myxococcota bacterium]HQK50690.1 phosphoribosylaminoimidazolesuccinocarboxamide synthase [Myxococcota bacterium]